MLALSIRQPYAELILRGMKTIEYRSRETRIVGERFYIYASKKRAESGIGRAAGAWSGDLVAEDAPPWMVELANGLRLFKHELPTGVIVGSAVIDRVSRLDGAHEGMWQWHLADVRRAQRLRKPKGHPQPVWWRPF
ncbi:MAG TPA: ASCH domain-containing protein [Tepidisphaeraceae bacterium]|nr:ASCH domain-containing protein [Tepidisphaeraceae bacterium]